MRRLALLAALLLAGCASPREKAMKRTMKDYREASAECSRNSRAQVASLIAAARAFYAEYHRWPYRLSETARFGAIQNPPLDELTFNQTTFASMSDGSLEIQYEINCSRFDPAHPNLIQRNKVRVGLNARRWPLPDLFRVAPELFQPVMLAKVGMKYMDHNVVVIHHDPAARRKTFPVMRPNPFVSEPTSNLIGDSFQMRLGVSRANEKIIRHGWNLSHVENDDVFGLLIEGNGAA
jgi:hypothetical protein